MHLHEKADILRNILRGYEKVAVAFSGGVDSSLLLKCALSTLGAGNVLVLFGRSELLKAADLQRGESWLRENGYPRGVDLEIIPLHPLTWKEVVNNPDDRCYRCKLRIYSRFREHMEKRGYTLLLDGTNIDDVKKRRPGLRANLELGVKMPLVEAGFDKADVRGYSHELGLTNWNLPSASCLATRIPHGVQITEERLRLIEEWERGIEKLGFIGCRVRMDKDCEDILYIEIAGIQFEALVKTDIRIAMLRFFQNCGIRKVFIDLEGRG